jgi:hypothetical protein
VPEKRRYFNPDDKKHLVPLQGVQYITVVGLQARAADMGITIVQSETEILRLPHENEDKEAIVKVKLWPQKDGKTFGPITAVGDASIKNVGSKLKEATLRMAETRGYGRALRVITRAPYTALEELPAEQNTDERVA